MNAVDENGMSELLELIKMSRYKKRIKRFSLGFQPLEANIPSDGQASVKWQLSAITIGYEAESRSNVIADHFVGRDSYKHSLSKR